MKNKLINAFYILTIFLFTLGVSTLALARKVNSYKNNSTLMTFTVDKDDIIIANSVVGRIEAINVQPGQHVDTGDILIELTDDSLEAKLNTLERFGGENLSALTQAQLIRAQESEYQIKAPRSGIVYQIDAAEGTYLPVNTKIITLFADNDVRLTTFLSARELEQIQRVGALDVFSPRLEQSYRIDYQGVGRVKQDDDNGELYEAIFTFAGEGVGVEFLEGETLEVIGVSQDAAKRPADYVTDLWNKLLLGN